MVVSMGGTAGAGAGVDDAAIAGAGGAGGAGGGCGVAWVDAGFVELGRFVQASSSNPLITGTAEVDRDGTWIGEVTRDVVGLPTRLICSDALAMEFKSTADGGVLLLGCGLPRRVLFFSCPPGPAANRLGAGDEVVLLGPPFSSCCSCIASSASRFICSSSAASVFGVVPVFWAMAFVTRMMSPSRRPRDLMVCGVMSGNRDASILSRSNDAA